MYSDKDILNLLVKKGVISKEKAKEFFVNKESFVNRLIVKRKKAGLSIDVHRPTIVDVLADYGIASGGDKNERLTEDSIYEILAEQLGFEYKKIDPLNLDLKLVTSTVHKSFAMKNLVLPLEVIEGCLYVAMPEPYNAEVVDDLKRVAQMPVKALMSSKTDVIKNIKEIYGFQSSIAAAENQFSGNNIDLGNLEQYVQLKSMDELPSTDHHIINAVNHLFTYSFDQRASDIHIEPMREETVVRMRIDGVLHIVYKLNKKVHNAIVSRIKAMSRLDMAEKRRPQDGRIKTDAGGVEVEIRVSTIPVAFGEKVVMRVLHPDTMFQDLPNLGFSEYSLRQYNHFIQMPHGIILVTGPTGSGKSTTLYSTLRTIASPEINITTVEDPIEMVHEGFNQIAVQPAINITFGSILRNILRQDPDVIMIGEMRDLETAENAAQAAMTGHLVLSTLHTNDAASAITRLLDLGVPAYIIQATLIGVMAQRLVRRICPHCKESFQVEAEKLNDLGLNVDEAGVLTLHKGEGCVKCRQTGYLGRIAIFEVLEFTDEVRALTTAETNVNLVKKTAIASGMQTLRDDAMAKMLAGETTYQEVLKVTWGADA